MLGLKFMGWKRSYPRANRTPLLKVGGSLLAVGAIASVATAAIGSSDIHWTAVKTLVAAVPVSAPQHQLAANGLVSAPKSFISYTEDAPCTDAPLPVSGPRKTIHRRKAPQHHKAVVHKPAPLAPKRHKVIHRPLKRPHRALLGPARITSCQLLHRLPLAGGPQVVAAAYYPSLSPIAATPQAPSNALDRSFSPLNPLNNYPEFPAGGGPRVPKTGASPKPPVSAAPEPETWFLMMVGVAITGLGLRSNRRKLEQCKALI